ncbi:MAG: cytochrome c [Saprospiraceae bacterium]|nr:cytochrome c [Saprospiraceae bacterium]
MTTIKQMTLLVFFCLWVWCCTDSNKPTEGVANIESKQKAFTIEAKMDIDTLLSRFDKEVVHIGYDFEVKKAKIYLGVNSHKIFSSLIRELNIDSSKYDVTFFCKDGYSPTVSLLQLLERNGYIVTKDVEAKDVWEEDIKAKFAPAYLVWDIPKNDHKHAFPYGIVQLQFIEKATEYSLAKPRTTAKEPIEGFALFKDKCIKCHSINQEGGIMGPELNYPKNITEYWQLEQIKLFIKNPSSFRANTKMPQLTELTDAQIDLIFKYLQFMTTQKIVKND